MEKRLPNSTRRHMRNFKAGLRRAQGAQGDSEETRRLISEELKRCVTPVVIVKAVTVEAPAPKQEAKTPKPKKEAKKKKE